MIFKTRNYNMFKLVSGNRDVQESHVKKLANSIGIKNMLAEHPITVNKNMEVIDGQHRLEAAKRLNLPIYYCKADDLNLSEVQLLNANQKSWTLIDFVNSYAKIGNYNYQTLKQFATEYNIPVSVAAEILNSNYDHDGLKLGNFVVHDEEKARRVANCLMEYRRYADPDIYRSRDFIRAVRHMVDREPVPHFKMVAKLMSGGHKIIKQPSFKAYLRLFEDIYNWHRGKDIVRFI